jgi:hypothetical protein
VNAVGISRHFENQVEMLELKRNEMIPLAFVRIRHLKNSEPGIGRRYFGKVRAIFPDKRHSLLDRLHVGIIKHNMPSGLTDERRQREINKYTVKFVVTVYKNEFESPPFFCEAR